MIDQAVSRAEHEGPRPGSETFQAPGLQYRRDIDGLRAIAVLSVVIYHVFPYILPGGFAGVDVFFVISGFLISRIIWDGLSQERFSFIDFYQRRIARIFPALGLVLAATWAAGYVFLFWDEFASLGKHILSGAFFVSNFTLWREAGYFDIASERKPLLHLWSLSIEEQFYLVWPLVLAAWWRLGRSFSLIAAPLGLASFVFSIYLSGSEPRGAFYNPLSRSWELLLGASIGHFVRSGFSFRGNQALVVSALSFTALVAAFFLFSRSTPFPGIYALLPAGATALLLMCHSQSGLNAAILSRRLIVGIGLISYPIYLWHWPIFSIAYTQMQGVVFPEIGVCIVTVSILLAWATYVFLEKPLRQRRRRWVVSGMLMVTVFGMGGVGWITEVSRGFIGGSKIDKAAPFTHSLSRGDWLREVRSGTCYIPDGDSMTYSEVCIEKARPLIFLWGDSHAATLYPGFRELRSRFSFGLVQMTQAGCAPLPGAASNLMGHCGEVNARIRSDVIAAKPEVLILAAAWLNQHYATPSSPDEVLAGLRAQLEGLRTALPNTKIVVIGPIIRWEPLLVKLLYQYIERTGAMPPRFLSPPDTALNRNVRVLDPAMRKVAQALGATYISPQDYFCDGPEAKSCLTRLEDSPAGLLVYDDSHLNTPAARYFISKLADILFG